MRARACLSVRPDGRLGRVVSAPPLTFRSTGDTVHLVGTAAGPLGDDVLGLTVDVAAGATLRLRSAAATILYSGPGTSLSVDVAAGAGAHVDWRPEPTIATAGCHHRQATRVTVDATASVDWTEELVLGRHGEGPGYLDVRLDVDHGGRPLLRHQLIVGAPGWEGPSGLGGHRAVGVRLLAGPARPVNLPDPCCGPGWAGCELDGPGVLLLAVGRDLLELRDRMASVHTAVTGG